jgi:hypothetical protein
MLAVTTYSVVVALHVVFVVSFLGAAGAFSVIGPAARGNMPVVPYAMGVVGTIQKKILIPGIVGVIVTGVYAIAKGKYSATGDAWLLVSLILFTLMGAAQFVLMPAAVAAKTEAEKILASDDPKTPTPELLAATGKLSRLGPFMGIGMMVITFLMVAKPF